MNKVYVVGFVVALFAAIANAHLCVYEPRQRGNMTINKPSGTCFRPISPCGGIPAEDPKLVLSAGSTFTIKFQQNLNHYAIGYPGYIDVAYAPYKDGLTDDDFTVVGNVPDYFAHREWTVTNMTYNFNVPNINCEHCVIRMRYVTHKPGEPIFHQCTDIKIQKPLAKLFSSAPQKSLGKIFGIYYNPLEDTVASLVQIDPVNKKGVNPIKKLISLGNVIREYNTKLDQENLKIENLPTQVKAQYYNNKHFANFLPSIMNSVATFATYGDNTYLYFLASLSNNFDQLPNMILQVNLNTLRVDYIQPAVSVGKPISAIFYDPKLQQFVLVVIENLDDKYQFQVYKWNPQTGDSNLITVMTPEDRFIDYIWSTYDYDQQYLYLLRRDEHDPIKQGQIVFTIDVKNGKVVNEAHVPFFKSFSNMQWTGSKLIAFTQGIPENATEASDFNLEEINPVTGEVNVIQKVPFAVQQWYGGNVFNWNSDQIYYQLYKTEAGKLALSGAWLQEKGQVTEPVESAAFNYIYNILVVPE